MGRIRSGWVVAAILLVVSSGSAAACGSDSNEVSSGSDGPSTESTTSTGVATDGSAGAAGSRPTGAVWQPNGVVSAWTTRYDWRWRGPEDRPTPAPDGELTTTGCRWLGPGRWRTDLEWHSEPAPTPDQPIVVPVHISYSLQLQTSGDRIRGPYAGTAYGLATLTGNGAFTLPMSGFRQEIPNGRLPGWWVLAPTRQWSVEGRCGAEVMTENSGGTDFRYGVDLVVAPEPIGGPPPRPGTVEELAATVPGNTDWAEAPMAALALLVTRGDVPVDRLYLDPDLPIDRIDVKHVDGCVLVTLAQGPSTRVRQSRDCAPESLPDIVEGGVEGDGDGTEVDVLPDDTWEVHVVRPTGYRDGVRAFAFDGAVEPGAAPSLDPVLAAEIGLDGVPSPVTDPGSAPSPAGGAGDEVVEGDDG